MPVRSISTNKVYKFVHRKDEIVKTSITGRAFKDEWLEIEENGTIRINASCLNGYAWDGCTPKFTLLDFTLGVPDGKLDYFTEEPITYYASMVHDILYQFKEKVPISRKEADILFRIMLKEASFKWWWLYYLAVRCFGGFFGKWGTKGCAKKIEVHECSWIREGYKELKKLEVDSLEEYPLAKIAAVYPKMVEEVDAYVANKA